MEVTPDIDANRQDYDILGWDLEPGDAMAFDYRTIHGAPANTSSHTQRRAFSLRLLGSGASFVRQPNLVSSPPFTEVNLQHGVPLVAAQFPFLLGHH